jgi:hypothetical protein
MLASKHGALLVADKLVMSWRRCVSGCTCDESEINGYHIDHNSLLKLHRVYVSQHEECVMAVQVSSQLCYHSTATEALHAAGSAAAAGMSQLGYETRADPWQMIACRYGAAQKLHFYHNMLLPFRYCCTGEGRDGRTWWGAQGEAGGSSSERGGRGAARGL